MEEHCRYGIPGPAPSRRVSVSRCPYITLLIVSPNSSQMDGKSHPDRVIHVTGCRDTKIAIGGNIKFGIGGRQINSLIIKLSWLLQLDFAVYRHSLVLILYI